MKMLFFCFWLCCLVPFAANVTAQESFVERFKNSFKNSEIEFQRGGSLVPFVPIAFLTLSHYDDLEVTLRAPNSIPRTNDVGLDQYSQGALIPFILDGKNAMGVGEYLSHSRFSPSSGTLGTFSVNSFGLPVGWLQQYNSQWQLAAFVMPLAHQSDLRSEDQWRWQYLGGAFARYVSSDSLWWAYGVYMEVGEGDNIYYPYFGLSWAINNHVTLSAVLPWPAILYSPNDRWLFSVGVSPSGASWNLNTISGDAWVSFDAWDFGVSGQRRVWRDVWMGVEAGVGGLRSLRFAGGDWEGAETSVSSTPFVSISVNYRPSVD